MLVAGRSAGDCRADLRCQLDADGAAHDAAGEHLRAATARRPRRSPSGIRVRQGHARAGRLRLARRRLGARLLRESRRQPDARTRLEADCERRAHDRAPPPAECRLRPAGHARGQVSVRRLPGPQVRCRAPRQGQGQGEDKDQDEAGRCSGSAEGKGDEDHCGRGEAESCQRRSRPHTRSPPSSCPARPRSRSTR